MTKLFLALLTLTFFAVPVHAAQDKAEPVKEEEAKKEESKEEEAKKEEEDSEEDKEDKEEKPEPKSVRFAPDFCDFEITFPEPPMNSKKCDIGGECYDVQSYTMVYDLSTTVDVTVTCNPSTPANYKRYTEQVMKAALAGMVSERQLDSHKTEFREYDDGKHKSAAITGTGRTGAKEKIYVGQLWAGPNSVFTIQAELVGDAHDVGDRSFRDILASIKTKEGKQLPKKPKPKNTSKAKNQ